MKYLTLNIHTAIVEEHEKLIDFNPIKEFGEVMDHIAKKMVELSD